MHSLLQYISGFVPYSVCHADSSPGRGWQPPRTRLETGCLFKNDGAALKAAWCLLRIATPCVVLRRLTVVSGHLARGGGWRDNSCPRLLLLSTRRGIQLSDVHE